LQNISTYIFVEGVSHAFDDNMIVIHVFIQQIFRAVEKAPPPLPTPLPPQCCAEGGVVMALFSLKQ
jgi:hypothetical protein